MNMRKILLVLSCITAAACLIAGVGSQVWLVAAAVIGLLALMWAIKPMRQTGWLASGSLLVYLCAAAGGLIGGSKPVWMMAGAIAALAGWDLIQFERSLTGAEKNVGLYRCEREHLINLGIALGLGSILAVPMLLVRIQLSFILMLAALGSALAGLLLAWRFLQKKNTP